ncbi:hypothetical protein K438DRAFT_1776648 [Mycena galopus ATCC 62051]|nr:hypothetical protein K438DRAFT_1776648 [Mycena galopus ATCC 62051]
MDEGVADEWEERDQRNEGAGAARRKKKRYHCFCTLVVGFLWSTSKHVPPPPWSCVVEKVAVAEVAKVEVGEAPARRLFPVPARGLSGGLKESAPCMNRRNRASERRGSGHERSEDSNAEGVSGLGERKRDF